MRQKGTFMWLAGVLFLCLLPNVLLAQVAIEWDRSLGGTSAEEYQAMLQTSDGGYIVAGSSRSHIYGDKTEDRKGEYDYWVVKISADGTKEWDKTIGGSQDDFLYSILSTPDGGYLLGGTSRSNSGGDKSSNDRNFRNYPGDFWIVKLSANGNKQWDKTLGGNGLDDLRYMEMTSDGGFLLGGNSNSGDNGDKTERIRGERNDPSNSGPDFWIVKITADGTKQWDKTIGGGSGELLAAVHQSPDGGYVLGGTSFSNPGYDKQSAGKGYGSYWLVKLAADRSIAWEKTFGGSGTDRMTAFQYTSDGGYLLSGYSSSGKTGDKTQASKGNDDYWVLKLTAAGSIQWQQTIGAAGDDRLQSVKQTPDGGYILGGYSASNAGFDKTENSRGELDYWLVKIAGNGQTEWNKTIGSNGLDELRTIMPTPDGGYILGGNSDGGMSGDKTSQTNNENEYINTSKFWIVKLLPESVTNKLLLSTQLLTFTQVPAQVSAPQSVTLSASEGTPEISLTKPPVGWLKLPDANLGNLAFSVDATGLLPGIYQAAVAMNAPGYIRTFVNIKLIVKNATAAPVLAHIGKRTVIVGHTVVFDADATTDIGVTRRFSLVNAPEGAIIDPRNGNFSWTPPFTGTFTFGVKVTDSSPEALSDQEPVTINVLDIYKNDTIRINAGGKDFTTADGRMFKADAYFNAVNPRTSSIESGDILNTTDDELYRTGRSSAYFSYRIPVPDGNYNVVLHFAEIWFGAPGGRPGKRRFNVDIDGVRHLNDFDITANAGGAMKATQVTIPVLVTSGTIHISFKTGFADMPRLAALEVLMTSRITKVSLPAIADSYVRSDGYANFNYGSADTLFVRSRNNKSLGFLKFSLGSLDQVTSAKLRIYGSCNCIYRGGVVIKGVDDDSWTENEINWNNAPKTTTRTFDLVVLTENERYYELDVTDYISQQAAGDKVATLLLEWTNDTRNTFNSRENTSNPPELLIATEGPVNANTRLAAKNAIAAPVLSSIGKRTVIVGHTVVFDADATTNSDVTRMFSLVNAPKGAIIDPKNGNFRWTPQSSGTFTFGVKVTESSPEALSDEQQVTINVLDIYKNDTIRINAGGKDYTTADGRLFKADAYFTAANPRTSSIDSGDILNTTDDELYRTGRSSPEFAYRIPVPDGNYNVVLHFAEIWFGAPGQRRFNINIDGNRKLTDFDITANAGGAMTATQVIIPVTITSGVININFKTGTTDIPRLAALEVLMTSRIIKVSLPVIADSDIRNGTFTDTNFGSADSLFIKSGKTRAKAYLKFSLAGISQVASAKIRVYGVCNCRNSSGVTAKGTDNDNWTENGITWNNAPTEESSRYDSKTVTENPQFYELNVTEFIKQQVAGDKIATLVLDWRSSDTRTILNSRENGMNPPVLIINAVGPVNSNARLDQDLTSFTLPSEAGPEKSSIYPNPVQKQFSVEFSEKHSGAISLNIISQQGRNIPVGLWQQSKTKSKAEFDISKLGIRKGMYLLKIESATETEVVRLLLTE